MDHYYYGRQNRTRPKKLPRSLLEQTPEDVLVSKKRRAKATVGATPKRSRMRLDILSMPAIGHKDVDSDNDMEATALANLVARAVLRLFPRTCPTLQFLVPDPRSTHPASVSNIPSNHRAAGPATNPTAAVSLHSNKNLLVDYLRLFKDEKDKAICKMSKTPFKLFGIISNGKCVNGVPYSYPTQFMSALCSFSRYLGVIYYPTKCKGVFSFDFGQTVFIEEFWLFEVDGDVSSVQALWGYGVIVDFSPKEPPNLTKT
jgi:hypothetical protein